MPIVDLSAAVPLFGAEDAAINPFQLRSLPSSPGLIRSCLLNSKTWVPVTAFQFTLSSQWGLETDYDSVRFIYSNDSASPYTITQVKVSPSAAVGDGTSPINSAGANDFSMFAQVFFNNAGLDVAPMDQTVYGSGTATFTVPANAGSLAQPTRWFSDWTRVSSLPRIDGGVQPLMMARTLTDALGTFRCSNLNTVGWSPFSQGRVLAGYFKQGVDSVTAPALISNPTLLNFLTPDGVQYLGRVNSISVVGIGDSLTQGQGSTTFYHSWAYLSCLALSTPSRPISYWSQAKQGQVSSDFWANGYTAMKAVKPEIVTIAAWSPNDGLTQATADAGWARAMELTNYAMKQGSVPVIMGPVPWSGITTAAQEAARLSVRTRMLQAGALGLKVLDWEAIIGTGASPNRIRPEFIAADNQHPNDVGNQMMDAGVFRSVLRDIIK